MNSIVRDKVEYAVRGMLVIASDELKNKIRDSPTNHGLPFNEIIPCNIGNPQALGQKPLTFFRQVMSLLQYPELLNNPPEIYATDAVARAKHYAANIPSIGAYSHSKGVEIVRREVATFMQERDGHPANPEDIYLTEGASAGVKTILQCIINDEKDGILIPIPQYPLYSATIPLYGGTPLHYYLDEEASWSSRVEDLEKIVNDAVKSGVKPKAIVVINPGNPTGQCLSKENIEDVIKFCHKHRIVLLADEVYQQNCYITEKPFYSFKKVARDLGKDYDNLELVSFHSISKGFVGECGQRGGYMEMVGIDPAVKEQIYKFVSISLCSNVIGQIAVGLMVNPPRKGDPSYELFHKESTQIYESLKHRAQKLACVLNSMEGVECNAPEGAMYLFPKITLSQKAIEEAQKKKLAPDMFYCWELLHNTGIITVPGSGFGQKPATQHFRTTFLPPEDKIDKVADMIVKFHKEFLAKYK